MPTAMRIWKSQHNNSCLRHYDNETEKYRVLTELGNN